MAKYAIIENDLVINVIEANQDFVEEMKINAILETEKTGPACIGGKFANNKFNSRELTPEELEGIAAKELRDAQMLNEN